MSRPSAAELRLGVLAVCVLHDVDLHPTDDGVALPGEAATVVTWHECREALNGWDPMSAAGRAALARWLLTRRWAAEQGPLELRRRLRPIGLPVGHPVHPGDSWVREQVLGAALELGLGALGLDPAQPDTVVPLPPPALAGPAIGIAWEQARSYLEQMGSLAADRLAGDPQGRLRPIGDCDVVTLLGARSLRVQLAGGSGMGAAVVPMRRRGWTRLALIDPAFGPAAAAATDPAERGFCRPLLITADEVFEVAAGGRPAVIALGSAALSPPAAWSS